MRFRKYLVVLMGMTAIGAAVTLLWTPVLNAYHKHQEHVFLTAPMRGRVLRVVMPSRMLHRNNILFVYLPPGYTRISRPFPVVYLLHGSPGEGRDWFAKGDIQHTAEREILNGQIPPMILVAFDGYGPGGPRDETDFLNKAGGSFKVEDYVASELPNYIDAHFHTDRQPQGRALMGLSAGGYAAVNIGLQHLAEFRVMASHSGFLDPEKDRRIVTHMLGPKGPLWDQNDPMKRLGHYAGERKCHIYLDCGTGDELLNDNRRFAGELTQYGIDHEFRTARGGHQWWFWRKQFALSLVFIGRHFRASTPPGPLVSGAGS